ncbi:MAG: SGNH/GDSL hydrolase family protein [Clostridia bacterium]|nr:SGNH/GDSL hydrolase family protein [Clostridia bacterium]
MKILFLGDSITDMSRNRETEFFYNSYGFAYPLFVEGELSTKHPKQFEILNKGISGNRVVDLYSRVKIDCWNHNPDVISIFIGVNDVWHGLFDGIGNGVDIERFEKVYRMLIDDTRKVLPNTKFILVAPFFLEGSATNERMDEFVNIYKYADVVRKIANDYEFPVVDLQAKFTSLANKNGASYYLYDGVHPTIAASKIIADEWLDVFNSSLI